MGALLLIILMPLIRNTGPLLELFGQSREHTKRISEVLMMLSWAVPGDLAYDCLSRWAKAQQRNWLVCGCAICALLINLVANHFFARADDPFFGPVVALVLQNTCLPILVLIALMMSAKEEFMGIDDDHHIRCLGAIANLHPGHGVAVC